MSLGSQICQNGPLNRITSREGADFLLLTLFPLCHLCYTNCGEPLQEGMMDMKSYKPKARVMLPVWYLALS